MPRVRPPEVKRWWPGTKPRATTYCTCCVCALDPHLNGACEPVVQPAPVAVPDQGRDREGEKHAAHQDPACPEPPAVLGDDAQSEESLARREADRTDGEHAQCEKDAERPVPGRLPVTIGEQSVCDQEAQPPVDEDGAEAPPEGAMEPGPVSGRPSRIPRWPKSAPMSSAAARGPDSHDPIACLLSTAPRYCARFGSLPSGSSTRPRTPATRPRPPGPVNLGETNGSCLRNPACLRSGPACATALAARRATTPPVPGRE